MREICNLGISNILNSKNLFRFKVFKDDNFLVVSLSSSVWTRTMWISPRESRRKCPNSFPLVIRNSVFPFPPLSWSVTVMAATREPAFAFSSTVANFAVWSGKYRKVIWLIQKYNNILIMHTLHSIPLYPPFLLNNRIHFGLI